MSGDVDLAVQAIRQAHAGEHRCHVIWKAGSVYYVCVLDPGHVVRCRYLDGVGGTHRVPDEAQIQ